MRANIAMFRLRQGRFAVCREDALQRVDDAFPQLLKIGVAQSERRVGTVKCQSGNRP